MPASPQTLLLRSHFKRNIASKSVLLNEGECIAHSSGSSPTCEISSGETPVRSQAILKNSGDGLATRREEDVRMRFGVNNEMASRSSSAETSFQPRC